MCFFCCFSLTWLVWCLWVWIYYTNTGTQLTVMKTDLVMVSAFTRDPLARVISSAVFISWGICFKRSIFRPDLDCESKMESVLSNYLSWPLTEWLSFRSLGEGFSWVCQKYCWVDCNSLEGLSSPSIYKSPFQWVNR